MKAVIQDRYGTADVVTVGSLEQLPAALRKVLS